ncbi:hypothetical protein JessAGP_024 [Caulobacter phage Jess A]|nr:hypothetical protein JessAGP_024 [Caulobacter phage Jess A]QNH91676.1 hypothetical protein SR18_gp025 [Caulobacter phage SR18]WCA46433.1 hypothetical protein [Caulobacter phage RapA]WCD56209.1 hypothetical protein [Caulobacter phage BL94]
MTDLANLPFAPLNGQNVVARYQPETYEEQQAAKVPRILGYQPTAAGLGPQWLMCRSDASMHRYRQDGPFYWAAFEYGNGQVTVHLFETISEMRWLLGHRRRWKSGVYKGHGRVRFKS